MVPTLPSPNSTNGIQPSPPSIPALLDCAALQIVVAKSTLKLRHLQIPHPLFRFHLQLQALPLLHIPLCLTHLPPNNHLIKSIILVFTQQLSKSHSSNHENTYLLSPPKHFFPPQTTSKLEGLGSRSRTPFSCRLSLRRAYLPLRLPHQTKNSFRITNYILTNHTLLLFNYLDKPHSFLSFYYLEIPHLPCVIPTSPSTSPFFRPHLVLLNFKSFHQHHLRPLSIRA